MKKLLLLLLLLATAGQAIAINLGDYAPSAVVYGKFTTYRPSTGASYTLAGTPALSVYKDNSTTQSTTGVTLTADFDSVTGLNHFAIDTSADGTFYSAGSNFDIVITTGTVDSVSVTGTVVGSFTIRKGTVTGIPNATAGASGGLLISGSNSGTTTLGALTVSGATTMTGNVSMAAGLNITQSSSNTAALVVTGNGTGNGATFSSGSGATGNGVQFTAASTNGSAIGVTKTGTGKIFSTDANVDVISAAGTAWNSGAITNASFGCTGGSFLILGVVDCGTAQSASSTGAVLRSAAAFGDDAPNGMTLLLNGSTQGYAQARAFTDFTGSTDTGVVDTWSVTPSGTLTYYLFGTSPSSGGGGDATEAKQDTILANLATVDTVVDAIKVKTDYLPSATAGSAGGVFIAGSNAATTVNFTGNLSGSVGSVTGAVGSVTGNVGGNVTGSVGSVTSGVTVSTNNDKTGYALSAASVDAVWDEARSGHTTAGTFGYYLDAAVSGVSTGGVSAGEIADAVWDEDMTAHQTQGTAGQVIGDSAADPDSIWSLANNNLNAPVGSRASQTSVDDVPTNSELSTALGTADDAVLAAIAALNNLSAEQVWQYVVEDQGNIQARCAMAYMMAIMGGDVSTTGTTSTYEESTGAETRGVGVVVSNGNRTMTLTCPTY